EWWASVVVHQDVGLWTGTEQRRLSLRRRHIGHDRRHVGAGREPQFLRCCRDRLVVAPVDDDVATGLREGKGAGAAKAAARGTHNGLAAGNSEIHGSIRALVGKKTMAIVHVRPRAMFIPAAALNRKLPSLLALPAGPWRRYRPLRCSPRPITRCRPRP